MRALARHLLAEYFGCDPALLDDDAFLRSTLEEAARRAGATVLGQRFHRFQPQGVSGVILLAESHISIHTWPEHGYAACDIFTCGSTTDPEAGHLYLVEKLSPARAETTVIERGEVAALERVAAGPASSNLAAGVA